MQSFPAFHILSARRVIVAGAGEAAARKARLAAAAGAKVVFIASGLDPHLTAEWSGRAEFDARAPSAAVFAGAALAFIAVDAHDEAAALARYAKAAGVPVNVVDRPDLSDFLTPSIVDRGEVLVAISTGGAAPVLGRRLRERIEAILPQNIGALAAFARSFRDAAAARLAPERRRAFWENFFDGPLASRVLAGDEIGARNELVEYLNRSQASAVAASGVVHLVGAGPGDPELLTLKALRLLQSADVIFHDRLVSDKILDLARRDALRFYVGKAKGDHSVPQEDIERRLIEFARDGKIVVRLKGGDPFIFGRGGEELDAVRSAGIPVFVTPGITAATGCAAAAGMPLTHRELSQAVTFITGHAKDDGEPELNWRALATLAHTLVVYMGVGKAASIAGRLIEHGRAGATPVAVIEKATTAQQKILKGRLSDLGVLVRAGGIEGPALLVIGEVAAKADGVLLEQLELAERRAA
ncbi:MAG: uroporphyrinogen-III C-methyltransferase [Alphaproteobacteria bacterium RIFCSPHIGHO2_12_FULL_63_12]|nr:MAG: uroporphyrinogen-III C-methyltransferase [Alphaproteobacteria bacterium RIFCSPHIGHO2_12_FULL_63_12]